MLEPLKETTEGIFAGLRLTLPLIYPYQPVMKAIAELLELLSDGRMFRSHHLYGK